MKTRTLLLLSVATALAILLAGGVFLLQLSNQRQTSESVAVGAPARVGDVSITVDRLILLGIASASAFLLWRLYNSSQFGLATEAVSESERSASAIGLSPNRIATLNWALGSATTGRSCRLRR